MSEWLKAVGGPVGVIVVGVGLVFALWPLGACVILVGVLLWLNKWDRVPFHLARRDRVSADSERRELLSLARAVWNELETCRYRLARVEQDHVGWFADRNLPAETYNTRWTRSVVTADQTAVNEALSGFYVWANEMNYQMARATAAQFNAIGREAGDETLLGWETIEPAREGMRRVTNAQKHLGALMKRLAP